MGKELKEGGYDSLDAVDAVGQVGCLIDELVNRLPARFRCRDWDVGRLVKCVSCLVPFRREWRTLVMLLPLPGTEQKCFTLRNRRDPSSKTRSGAFQRSPNDPSSLAPSGEGCRGLWGSLSACGEPVSSPAAPARAASPGPEYDEGCLTAKNKDQAPTTTEDLLALTRKLKRKSNARL